MDLFSTTNTLEEWTGARVTIPKINKKMHVTRQGLQLDFIDLVAVNSILVLYSLFNKSKGLLQFHRYSVKCFKTNRQATESQNS